LGLFGIAGGWLRERVSESLVGWFSSRLPRADETAYSALRGTAMLFIEPVNSANIG
jgi:hypothetical protein